MGRPQGRRSRRTGVQLLLADAAVGGDGGALAAELIQCLLEAAGGKGLDQIVRHTQLQQGVHGLAVIGGGDHHRVAGDSERAQLPQKLQPVIRGI